MESITPKCWNFILPPKLL